MLATLTLPLQSSGKMEVTPQQSEILQKELFKMGFYWNVQDDADVQHTDKPFLFWDNLTMLYASKENVHLFELDELPLHLFDNHFKIEE